MLGCRLAGEREESKKKQTENPKVIPVQCVSYNNMASFVGGTCRLSHASPPSPPVVTFRWEWVSIEWRCNFFLFVKVQNKLFFHWTLMKRLQRNRRAKISQRFYITMNFPKPLWIWNDNLCWSIRLQGRVLTFWYYHCRRYSCLAPGKASPGRRSAELTRSVGFCGTTTARPDRCKCPLPGEMGGKKKGC